MQSQNKALAPSTGMNETKTVRVVSGDTTFYVTLTPQRVGAMGAEIEGWSASIQLGAAASGGYTARQALAMLADYAKKFVRGTITVADLPDDERGLYAQAP